MDHGTRDKLSQLIREGRYKGPGDAARELGVSRQRISLVERPQTRERLSQLASEGRIKSHADAAKLLGVSRSRVSYILARAGISTPRPSSRVEVVCEVCGKKRQMLSSKAKQLRTGLCGACWATFGKPSAWRRKKGPHAGNGTSYSTAGKSRDTLAEDFTA